MNETTARDSLIQRSDNALRYLIESGNTAMPQYDLLSMARSSVKSEPLGSPSYEMQATTAEAQINQINDFRAAELRKAPTSDPQFAADCPDCQPGQPCCLRAYEVSDESDASRKVVWPIQDGAPKVLYVVAKDPYHGRPSADVVTKLTDFEPCQMGTAGKPSLPLARFDTNSVANAGEAETSNKVTLPFNPAAVTGGIFPQEIMVAMYVCGYYVLASSYKPDSALAQVNPGMTMLPASGGPKVKAVPHIALNMSVAGEVSMEVFLDDLPTFGYALSGSVTGEITNTTLSYKGGVSSTIATRREPLEGPIYNSFMGTISKIYEKVSWMSSNSNGGIPAAAHLQRASRSSIKVTLGAQLTAKSLLLKGKTASPDLELAVDEIVFRLSLGIVGKMDLLDLLISRVPKLSDSLREARASLAKDGNLLQVKLECELVLGAEGGVQFGVENAATIAIGSDADWEKAFDNLSTVFQADSKITGRLRIEAKVGVDTWLFDGSVEASGSVGTGWHFGGRITGNADGTQKTETLYWFEGLRVQGSYAVRAGALETDRNTDSFDTGSETTVGETVTTAALDNRTVLLSGRFDESFFVAEGGPNDWKES